MIYIFLLLFPALSSATNTCNNLRISSYSQTTVNIASAPAVTAIIRRTGGNGCDFFFTFDYGSGGSYNNRRLVQNSYSVPMNIYKDSAHTQILKQLPDATTTADVITGTFPNGNPSPSTITITFYPQLGSTSYNRFGSYTDSFRGKVYNGTPAANFGEEDHADINMTYTMAKKIDLSIVPTGGVFNLADVTENISFGSLVAGAVRTFDILVKYNAGYLVKISSANQGRLKHASYTDTVPYTLAVNSSAVSLSGSNTSPVTVTSGTGVSPANGLLLSSSVTINSVGNARAGNYSDQLTVTVQTNE